MAGRPKRRRLNPDEIKTSPIASDESAATANFDKARWHGFCEVESEPALFNVMLKEFGVSGVKIQEIVSLDSEMLQFLHKPIYGLVFLFRWKEDDPVKQEQSCPEGLWFANQTASNACASVALLNIINNVEQVDLGEELRHFKEFTKDFTPALRGDAINNFEFIKGIHNSFARKMDILNADLQLKNEATAKRSKGSKKNQGFVESEAGFHFIAFVPVEGKIWKFDGLERQPHSIGQCSGDEWLEIAMPEIQSRMAEYEEDQIEFSILGLVKDPITTLASELAMNVKKIVAIDERLCSSQVPQKADSGDHDIVTGPDPAFHLTPTLLDEVLVPENDLERYKTASREDLLGLREILVDAQKQIRASIKEEQQARHADEDYANKRRHDYGPAVHTWVRALARKGLLEQLAKEA